MATDKETKNKESKTSKTNKNKNIGSSSTGTGKADKEGTESRSKAEMDQMNPEFESRKESRKESGKESRRTGPSTGGYGDQHDPQRYRDPQNSQFDSDRSGYRNESSYSDYDRGFRDGAEHASRYYNRENWNRENRQRRGYQRPEGNRGYANEPRYGRSSGYERFEPGTFGDSYPYNNYGDVDGGSSRSYPSMQSGYGDRNPYRYDVRDEFDTEMGRNRPYGEESYRRGDTGEQRPYRGNEYGSPYERERYESENRGDRGPSRSDRERHLKNEPTERESGDRDREW